MKNRNEKGYAIIMLLVLTAVLMISLSTAISILGALRRQNKESKTELKQKEERINTQFKKADGKNLF